MYDEEYKKRQTKKGSEYVYTTVMYTVVSFWGWIVLKDSPHLPWFMGGKADPYEAFEST